LTAASALAQQYGGYFHSLAPCRVFDSRFATPPNVTANTPRTIPMLSNPCLTGVPSDVVAYSVNVTVVPISGNPVTYVQAYGAGTPPPTYPMLESSDGLVYAHGAIVNSGTNGDITLLTVTTTDLIVDINGYFSPSATAGGYHAVTPCRAVDTRGTGMLHGGTFQTFDLTGSNCAGSITYTPSAFALNLTAINRTTGGQGFVTAYPAYQTPRPNVSTINVQDSNIIANFAIVPSAGAGNIYVSFYSSLDVDIVVDVMGYFTAAPTGSDAYYQPNTPWLLMDPSGGVVGAGSTTGALLTSPYDPSYVAFNLDVSGVLPQAGPLYYITAWNGGVPRPLASTLNDAKGITMSNTALVPNAPNGGLQVYVTNSTYLRVAGYGFFRK